MPDAFLALCELPSAWAQQPQWRVLDTRWRDGQRFLATWAAWRADPARPRVLHYIVLQAAPGGAARPDNPTLQALADTLNAQLWGLLPGLHRIALEGGQVLLTLCVGAGALEWLRPQGWTAETIFLDGLSADNAQHSAKTLARSCRRGTQLLALEAEPAQADWLERSGFVLARPGPGLLHATYQPRWQPRSARHPSAATAVTAARCIVIGAGLAGAASAASLARRGWQVRVLDAAAQPAAGASGLPVGVFAPHPSLDDNPLSRLARSGVRALLQYAAARLQAGVDWQPDGVLEQRIGQPLAPLADWSQSASMEQLRAAGLPDDTQACWHARGGWLRPARLVAALLAQPGITWQANARVAQLQQSAADGVWRVLDSQGALLAEAELVVLAAGPACNALLASLAPLAAPLPLQPVRGQISWGLHPAGLAGLPPFPANGHGGLVAQVAQADGGCAWYMGSTFERDIDRLPPSAADQAAAHARNWQQLQTLLPSAAAVLQAAFDPAAPSSAASVRAWAGVRCTAPDRLPLVGPMNAAAAPGLWVCTAMGARGLTLALLCGELLAAQLHGEPLPLEARLARALMPRFGLGG